MTSIHLALACGYVRSLARMRTWGEFSQVSPKERLHEDELQGKVNKPQQDSVHREATQ